MSRFERRKITREQRTGSIYSNRRVQQQPTLNNTNQNQQILSIIKKHDDLLTRLLKRFNDMETTLNAKIESLIENKINEFIEDIEAKINSININNISNEDSNDNNVRDINNNEIDNVIIENDNVDYLNELNGLMQNMNDDVVKKNDFEVFTNDIRNSLNEMKSVISSIKYNNDVKEVINNYEKNRDTMFYEKKEEEVESEEVESDMKNETKIKKEVSEAIKEGTTLVIDTGDDVKSKNIELEIVEN